MLVCGGDGVSGGNDSGGVGGGDGGWLCPAEDLDQDQAEQNLCYSLLM